MKKILFIGMCAIKYQKKIFVKQKNDSSFSALFCIFLLFFDFFLVFYLLSLILYLWKAKVLSSFCF